MGSSTPVPEVDNTKIVIGRMYKHPDTSICICNQHFSDLLCKISNE